MSSPLYAKQLSRLLSSIRSLFSVYTSTSTLDIRFNVQERSCYLRHYLFREERRTCALQAATQRSSRCWRKRESAPGKWYNQWVMCLLSCSLDECSTFSIAKRTMCVLERCSWDECSAFSIAKRTMCVLERCSLHTYTAAFVTQQLLTDFYRLKLGYARRGKGQGTWSDATHWRQGQRANPVRVVAHSSQHQYVFEKGILFAPHFPYRY